MGIGRMVNTGKSEGKIKILFSFRNTVFHGKKVRIKLPTDLGGGLISVPENCATDVGAVKTYISNKIGPDQNLSNFNFVSMQATSKESSNQGKPIKNDIFKIKRTPSYSLKRQNSLVLQLVRDGDFESPEEKKPMRIVEEEKKKPKRPAKKVIRVKIQPELGGGLVSIKFDLINNISDVKDLAIKKLQKQKKLDDYVQIYDFKLISMVNSRNNDRNTIFQSFKEDYKAKNSDLQFKTPFFGLLLRSTKRFPQAHRLPVVQNPNPSKIKVGNVVDYNTENGWQKGRVVCIHKNGTFTIRSDNDDLISGYPQNALRLKDVSLVEEEYKQNPVEHVNTKSKKEKIFLNLSSTVADVVDWLRQNNLSHYEHSFMEKKINGEAFVNLNENDVKPEDWVKFYQEIANINGEEEED